VIALILLLACHGKDEWTPPDFAGDGLPDPTETDHIDNRNDNFDTSDTARGGDSGATGGGSAAPTFDIEYGLFAYIDYYGYLYGVIGLFPEEQTCEDVFGTQDSFDGIYFYVYPTDGENWIASYPICGNEPCSQAFWVVGDDFGYLDEGISIESMDPHYVEASWDTEVSADSLRFYNCGDYLAWYY
jgi:hypothetical protein